MVVDERQPPPVVEAGGVRERASLLRSDSVDSVPRLVLGGFDSEPHLLAEGAGDEAADTVGLMPTSA